MNFSVVATAPLADFLVSVRTPESESDPVVMDISGRAPDGVRVCGAFSVPHDIAPRDIARWIAVQMHLKIKAMSEYAAMSVEERKRDEESYSATAALR